MREKRAQIVQVVRAFEEVDREGRVLPAQVRSAATRRAIMVTGLADWDGELSHARNIRNGETVFRRARLLFSALGQKFPALLGILKVAQQGSGIAPALVGAAFLVGVAANLIGSLRTIGVVSLPLLAMLAWNLLAYGAVTLGPLVRRWPGRRAAAGEPPETSEFALWIQGGAVRRLADLFLRWTLWRSLYAWKRAYPVPGEQARITAEALVRFAASWRRLARPLMEARVRRMLHLGAVAMVTGMVGGMYVRSLALGHPAEWNGTLVDPETVQALVGLVLGPASALLGMAVPDVLTFRSPGDGAVWVHLYAMTALLFVVLPRSALTVFEKWRVDRFAASLQVDLRAGYFRRIFTEWRGATRRVEIAPYGCRPRTVAEGVLKTLLYDSFGARADIRMREPLEYGGRVAEILPDLFGTTAPTGAVPEDETETYYVVLYGLAQSPEGEDHGAFLEDMKARVEARGGQLLVLVDVSDHGRRGEIPEGLNRRWAAWRRVTAAAGLDAVDVDLDRPAGAYAVTDDLMDAVRAGLWPRRELAGAG